MAGMIVGNGNGQTKCTRCGSYFDGRRRHRGTGWCPRCCAEHPPVEPAKTSVRPRTFTPDPDQRVPSSWKRYGS